jgi:glycosyltransferase involved in cell wall biosynthesis
VRLQVGFDAHLLSRSRGYRAAGMSRHIENLLEHLPAAAPDVRLSVFVGPDGLPDAPPRTNVSYRVARLRTERPRNRIVWEQLLAPGQLRGLDVCHFPANVVTVATTCRRVVTVHDLSFERFPELFHRANRAYQRAMVRLSTRLASRVIAVSDSTRRDLVELLGVPERKIEVIPNGVEPAFRPRSADEVAAFRAEKGLPADFILYLGTLEPRKNLLTLLRAYARLRRTRDLPHALVLAGGKGWLYETIFAEVERLGLGGQVYFPGFVDFDEQPLWYNAAAVFAYPSLYEGFGLPPLEAMACGTPVVTSDATSLPEVVGDAGLMVAPTDESALADALGRLIDDEPLRARLRAAGPARAAGFGWDSIARRTAAVYRAVA